MKSKLLVAIFMLLNFCVQAAEVTHDGCHTITRKSWSEISLENQRDVIRYFEHKLTNFLEEELHVPPFWNDKAEKELVGSQKDYSAVHSESQAKGLNYASQKEINLDGLLPSGFMVGLGVSGTANFVAGLEGAALITLFVAPYEIETVDNMTGETVVNYEASWSVGGIGQQAAGAGAGAGFVVKGAVGLIWGELGTSVDLSGFAVGVSASIEAVQGLGFKVANLFNQATGKNNLLAMATYDIGVEVSAGVQAAMYYIMNAEQVLQFVSRKTTNQTSGVEIFQLSQ